MFMCFILRLSFCWYSQFREDYIVYIDGGYDEEVILEFKGYVQIDIEWWEIDYVYFYFCQIYVVCQGQYFQEVFF